MGAGGGTFLAVDAMSGEYGPEETVPGVITALRRSTSLRVLLIGQLPEINRVLSRMSGLGKPLSRISTLEASQALLATGRGALGGSLLQQDLDQMSPGQQAALTAMIAVRNGQAEACVSCAESSALLQLARDQLPRLKKQLPIAMCAILPGQFGRQYLLDVGDCDPAGEADFGALALMGITAAVTLEKKQGKMPAALLGNPAAPSPRIKEADAQLASFAPQLEDMQYQGIMSGELLFSKLKRVLICDAASGALLKQALYAAAQESLRAASSRRGILPGKSRYNKEVRNLSRQMAPLLSYDALLLGFSRVVMKSSQGAQSNHFAAVLGNTLRAVQGQLVENIAQGVERGAAPRA